MFEAEGLEMSVWGEAPPLRGQYEPGSKVSGELDSGDVVNLNQGLECTGPEVNWGLGSGIMVLGWGGSEQVDSGFSLGSGAALGQG